MLTHLIPDVVRSEFKVRTMVETSGFHQTRESGRLGTKWGLILDWDQIQAFKSRTILFEGGSCDVTTHWVLNLAPNMMEFIDLKRRDVLGQFDTVMSSGIHTILP